MSPKPNATSVDQARLLPRYRLEQAQAAIFKAEFHRANTEGVKATSPMAQADPGDLRGIPCIARGVGGTQPGTAPHTAIEHLDRKPSFFKRRHDA